MAVPAADLLTDVRVVDLTDAYGSFAAKLLADLGAEVVRVEAQDGGRGREGRHGRATPPACITCTATSANSSSQRAIPRSLTGCWPVPTSRSAPIPVPIVARQLSRRHPHLVVVSMTPFGISGPTARLARDRTRRSGTRRRGLPIGVAELPPVSAPGSYCEDVGAVVGGAGVAHCALAGPATAAMVKSSTCHRCWRLRTAPKCRCRCGVC